MTYCAGWKYKDSIYLWADTVAARPLTPRRQTPSLGELQTEIDDDPVEASSLKLLPIAPGTAVAYTGDVALATRLLDFLRRHHDGATSHADLLLQLDSQLGPFNADQPVALLLASSTPDGSAELLCWTTEGGLADAADFHQIGSTTPYHAALTPELLSVMARGELAPDLVLPIIGAIVQSRGVRDVAIDLNADGLIVGLRTGQGAVSWQDDTLVVLYEKAFASSSHVSALVRDDALVVHASVTDDTLMFVPAAEAVVRQPADAKWRHQIKAELNARRFRFQVFISTSEKVITLIIRNDHEQKSDFVRLGPMRNGRFHLALSPEMMALLTQSPRERAERDIPFRLSVRED
ncbi:MAG: hypothetical protein QFE16_08690 [Pseudomonadota bacterium]|nr:hypothetical protein [Pseudomonadota bacterium]